MALAVVGGGRRCGKSRYALALAAATGPRLGFVATLTPNDEESMAKVEAARKDRGPTFITVEEPLELVRALEQRSELLDAVVVDDLTVWVSNMAMAGRSDEQVEQEAARLVEFARASDTETIVVTSDVDFGFPMDGLESRRIRRLAGLVNFRLADAAERLYWMVFGVPQRIR